jgi:hypothetical protein
MWKVFPCLESSIKLTTETLRHGENNCSKRWSSALSVRCEGRIETTRLKSYLANYLHVACWSRYPLTIVRATRPTRL